MGTVHLTSTGDSLTLASRHYARNAAHFVRSELAGIIRGHCLTCSRHRADENLICSDCRQEIQGLPTASNALYRDRPPLGTLVRAAKNERVRGATQALWTLASERTHALVDDLEIDIITWIPADRWRTVNRGGWCLPQRFCRHLSSSTSIACEPLLSRSERSVIMRGQSRRKRRLQADHLYQENPRRSQQSTPHPTLEKSPRVLLLDDVRTTGATLQSGKAVLEQAGWQVFAIAIIGRD